MRWRVVVIPTYDTEVFLSHTMIIFLKRNETNLFEKRKQTPFLFFFWVWISKKTLRTKKKHSRHCSSFFFELTQASWPSLWRSILGKKGRDAQNKSYIFLFTLFTRLSHHLSLSSILIFLKDGPDLIFRFKMIFFLK